MSSIGSVDTLWDTCISGWAADQSGQGGVVQVDIVVNSVVVSTIPCATFREDLLAAGIGDGRKGFRFDPGAYLKPGRNNLEVRYAGTREVVRNGRGVWVNSRQGPISEWQAALVAALEAYHEFSAEDHICALGKGAAQLERVLIQAGIPFRKFTRLDLPGDPCDIWLAERADLVISWAWPKLVPESRQILQYLVQDHMNERGLLLIGITERTGAAVQIRQSLEECGAPRVKLESGVPVGSGPRQILAFAAAGWTDAPGVEGRPVLAHIHVPKCAGTSFRVLQERCFGQRHLELYVDDTYFVFSQETLRAYLLQNPGMQGFSSHHVRVFPRWLAGREMFYVTFLRDPIQQFVSYMTHFKKYYSRITSPSLLEAVPPDAPKLALREFARWLLTQDRDIPFRENHNVNFFARHSAPTALDRLQAAKAALEGFFFVGITERMEESMCKLRALAETAGLEFPPDPLPVENVSADYRDDLSWINPDDEVGSLLLRSVEKDRQLYDWAVARFGMK